MFRYSFFFAPPVYENVNSVLPRYLKNCSSVLNLAAFFQFAILEDIAMKCSRKIGVEVVPLSFHPTSQIYRLKSASQRRVERKSAIKAATKHSKTQTLTFQGMHGRAFDSRRIPFPSHKTVSRWFCKFLTSV